MDLASAASSVVASAPCCVLTLAATGAWQDAPDAVAAFEERCAGAASIFGRVLDVRLAPGAGADRTVRVYFEDGAGAAACGYRFACNGVERSAAATYENMGARRAPLPACPAAATSRAPSASSAASTAASSTPCPPAPACSSPSRRCRGRRRAVADGAAFGGRRCCCDFREAPGRPCCVLANAVADAGDLDDLSKVEVVGDFEDASGGFGNLRRVVLGGDGVRCYYDENRGAAACAASMDGRRFEGRELSASALAPRPEAPKPPPAPETGAATLERAVAALRASVAAEPRVAQTRANLAGALVRVGGVGNLEEAARHAKACVALKGDWPWGHFRLGSAYFALGKVREASVSLAMAETLEPTNAHDDEGELLNINSRAHCYICKQWGHSKRDCPMAKCQYCHEIGHRKHECPLFTAALGNAAEAEKKARRKQGYEKKRAKRKEEWTAMLREKTGVDSRALYRVLGLPERKLSTAGEIKKAYHKRSLQYHPDKHPDDREAAHERFLEIKAAYELLLEGDGRRA
ncbi:hypothetical protein JL720_4677 [Aureococcus anophagefferens]|nr:hypothetical protein JL720_4677 [Aureococcus anophagefferens]